MGLTSSESEGGEAYEKLDGSSPKRQYHSFTDGSHLLIQGLKVAPPNSSTVYYSKDQLPITKISQSLHPQTHRQTHTSVEGGIYIPKRPAKPLAFSFLAGSAAGSVAFFAGAAAAAAAFSSGVASKELAPLVPSSITLV